ncbi:hypothetical protein [Sphingomonas sp. LT1P40]|uniref:hypothetical protein n=1 Tax=Alteristakelama amylovorans TaxID=3096166 RepID=UPI002FC81134
MMRIWVVIAAALATTACSEMSNEQQAALVENAVANAEAMAENVTDRAKESEKAKEAPNRDAWVGKWIGVEGLVLTIEKDATTPGRYRLTNKYGLDDDMTGTFDGVASQRGITFTRPDGPQELVPGDGESTDLKYLAGKKDCLIVSVGEGYCRD